MAISGDVKFYESQISRHDQHIKACYSYKYKDDYYYDYRYGELEEYKMDCYPALYDSASDYLQNNGTKYFSIFFSGFIIFEIIAVIILLISNAVKKKNKKSAIIAENTTNIID